MSLVQSPYNGLYYSPGFTPREVFSVSQIEKAFGSAHEPNRGCLRSWAFRYLLGLKEPEYTYEEACALPEDTPELAKLKGGIKKKTYGKVFHRIAEEYYRGAALDLSDDASKRFFHGSHLAPHPSQCAEIEIEKPIKVRTGPEGDTITWNGFKDLVVRIRTDTGAGQPERYLFDWKTTTPTVDNRRNREQGKPEGAWTWQKNAKAIKIDYQANLYAYDELVNYGALPRGRWIYFANSGKPDARATDYEPELPLVTETVRVLDEKARELRGMIWQFRYERENEDVKGAFDGLVWAQHNAPANLANCAAFGGCPYRSSVGGPCTAEQNGVIPIGSLSRNITRPNVKQREAPPALGPGFVFEIERRTDMGLAEDIAAAKAQRTGQAGAAPTPAGFAPQGAPPVPWMGPAAVTANAGTPFDPSFAFGQAPAAPAAPPPAAPPQPTLPAPGQAVFGSPSTANAEWASDGIGGWFRLTDLPLMAGAGDARARALYAPPQAPAPAPAGPPTAPTGFPSHVNPPEAASPTTPPAQTKKGPGRPKKDPQGAGAAPAGAPAEPRDTTPAPADFSAPSVTVTLTVGTMVVTVPVPTELTEVLQAHVLKAVSG